ncbi:MAG: right-handed parallel beta-helix repeat-containing protein [Verrucomicrobia bacterium]|nr:right-handed parallel beta-helix repeat-containing protein [Verrucomicrobiota bacterium]
MCQSSRWAALCLATVIALLVLVVPEARSFVVDLNVEDEAGNPVQGFRWLAEIDPTHQVTPGVPWDGTPDALLSIGIHKAYAPVANSGHSDTDGASIDLPDGHNFLISVLPDSGEHAMNGIRVTDGQDAATAVVNTLPVPTAQVSVYVFHDNRPVNNAPDLGAEAGLEGFSCTLTDQAGQQMADAFGNMIGTTYMKNPDGTFILDGDGSPVIHMEGTGVVLTDANGEALIKNLAPGKYGVVVSPPYGETWIQTTTIEGGPLIDAWVASAEPAYLGEFGYFFWHTFYGFVQPMEFPEPEGGTVGTIAGTLYYIHEQRPPLPRGNLSGRAVEEGWVALNDLSANDQQVYAGPADENGYFQIDNVPPGTYQLVAWDRNMDVIIGFRTVIVPAAGGLVDLGQVAQWAWFGFFEGSVFIDANQNGYRDPGEMGIPEQAINIRFIDGSLYQITPTDMMGEYSFAEVFPFFYWLVTEVDFARYKATGATFITDDGGVVAPGEVLNAQEQPDVNPNTGDNLSRTDVGVVLTQAMLLYAGQTNKADWGKWNYAIGENGGISGIVYYATTRAEDDPRFAAGEPWEIGLPRVQVNLYADWNNDQKADDVNDDGEVAYADVDNFPFDWSAGGGKGDEDTDHNGNGVFDPGDAIQVVWTDSWDDSLPDGIGPPQLADGYPVMSGAETYATWNQQRPGVFNGGYAFDSYFPGGMPSVTPGVPPTDEPVEGLPSPRYYVVECVPPPHYLILSEEHKNVDFGDSYIPYESGGPGILAAAAGPILGVDPPICVGDLHPIPPYLTLFPDQMIEAPWASDMRPKSDRKLVFLSQAKNAACDFFCLTEVPKGGLIWGWVTNDVLYENDPTSPSFGTNFALAYLPVSIQDFAGHEIARVYTDQWGKYTCLVPSTYTVSVPNPTGVSPNVLIISLNDPGPIPDPDNPGETMFDPWYNPGYGRTTYRFEFFPGKTTRLDTPVLPIGAFMANRTPVDVEPPTGTPVIYSVQGPNGGPFIPNTPPLLVLQQLLRTTKVSTSPLLRKLIAAVLAPNRRIMIRSVGIIQVPNPDYDPDDPASTTTVPRDYGFGNETGTVTLDGVALPVASWADDIVEVDVPTGRTTGQLMLTTAGGVSTRIGVTLHIGGSAIQVNAGGSIQAAIDAAVNGQIILVAPGTYKENLFLWKPVKLQGWGAPSTRIQAGPVPPDEDNLWGEKLQWLLDTGKVNLLPGQQLDYFRDRTAGITILGNAQPFTSPKPVPQPPYQVDGLTITGTAVGGGIYAVGYTKHVELSNNRLINCQGNYGGGIRSGTPTLLNATGDGYYSCHNEDMDIHHNEVFLNGAFVGAGGIALFNGTNYKVTENWIGGNFSLQYGGGIAHFGLSQGEIRNNVIFNNQAFDEGGGIMVTGELIPAGAPPGTLTQGAGNVIIDKNLIQGNLSGDDGGGIRTLLVNGEDVRAFPSAPSQWHTIWILNNLIVNNSAADAGGGISLDDTARAFVYHNTIACNDSTGTGVDTFGPAANENEPLPSTIPQVAGISSNVHSTGLQGAFGAGFEQTFSNPELRKNILWQNRSFYWDAAANGGWGGLAVNPAVLYWDLGVYNTLTPEMLEPQDCVLSELAARAPDGTIIGFYDASNMTSDPLLVEQYFNVHTATAIENAFGALVIDTFAPLGLLGDYHILESSPARDAVDTEGFGQFPDLLTDVDGDARPGVAGDVDVGADEYVAP